MHTNVFQTDNNKHEKRSIIYKNISSICFVALSNVF